MRPIWSGTLAFGLVTIPVKLYSAVESSSEVSFRLLDRETLTPIKEIRVNPETKEEIPWERIVRGVEHAKEKYVALTSEELKSLPLPTAHTVELLGFVDAEEISPLYFDKAYYLGPGKGGEKAYELLRRTLEEEGKVGLGKVAIRTREHLAAVRPTDGALVMQTLYYADEVRAADEIPDLPKNVRVLPAERKMAEQLIGSMVTRFDPAEYKSDYQQALRKLIKAKMAGRTLPEPQAPRKVIDLQEALRASLARMRSGAKPARRRAATG
ncbi:MAG: Ku protein [Armatimonadetes bacterium]|nr:Ku protein [Armatimonadota bacterium]